MYDLAAVASRLRSGEAVLFVGAGGTRDGGGRSWSELAERIAAMTSYRPEPDEVDPQEVIDGATRIAARYERAYEGVQRLLEPVVAPPALRQLLDLPWLAVCTTNYDTAIEDHYREHSERNLDIVRDGRRAVQFGSDRMPIFKLRGCRTVPPNKPGSMLLATRDIRRHNREQAPMYDHLDELAQTFIVAVGYSFGDRLLIEAAEQVRSLKSNHAVPILGVFREAARDEKERLIRDKLRRLGVTVAEGLTVEQLAADLRREIGDVKFEKSIAIRVHGGSISVTKRAIEDALHSLQPVTDEECRRPVSAREFLRGDTSNAGAYEKDREIYWRRPAHEEAIRAFEKWASAKRETPRHLLVNFSGPPGSGRTVASFALLHHVINQHNAIGLKAPPRSPRLDSTAASQVLHAVTAAQKWDQPPFLAVCTDEQVNLADALHFAAAVQSPDHGVLIIRASSENLSMFSRETDTYQIVDIRLPDQIGPDEVDSLSEYISRLPAELRIIPWNRAEILEAARGNPSFLHLMYTLVDPAKRSFQSIILDEFARSDPPTRKFVQTLALFTAMRIPLPSSLIAKALRVPQDDLKRRAAETKLVNVERDGGGLHLYSLYHQIVGRLLIDPSHGLSRASTKEIIREVVTSANLTNSSEHRAIAEMMVPTHDAPVREFLEDSEVLELFEELRLKGSTRLLLHHHGLLLRDKRQYGEAITILREALDQPDERRSSSERREIVSTSLAHVQWLQIVEKEKPALADDRVNAIRIDLAHSRATARNPNAYTIESRVLRDIAQWTPSPEREDILGQACAILQDGLRTCGAEEEGLIEEMRVVLDASTGFTLQHAYDLYSDFGSGYGFFLLYERAKHAKKPDARESLEIALEARIPCPPALREAIHLELNSPSPDYKAALAWSDRLFEFAESHARLARIDRFDHIQRVTSLIGAEVGSQVGQHVVAARNGEAGYDPQPYRYLIRGEGAPILYSGRVKEIVTPRSGRIFEHNVRGLGDLHFNPAASSFAKRFEEGEKVNFEIAVGARGITAWQVRPV